MIAVLPPTLNEMPTTHAHGITTTEPAPELPPPRERAYSKLVTSEESEYTVPNPYQGLIHNPGYAGLVGVECSDADIGSDAATGSANADADAAKGDEDSLKMSKQRTTEPSDDDLENDDESRHESNCSNAQQASTGDGPAETTAACCQPQQQPTGVECDYHPNYLQLIAEPRGGLVARDHSNDEPHLTTAVADHQDSGEPLKAIIANGFNNSERQLQSVANEPVTASVTNLPDENGSKQITPSITTAAGVPLQHTDVNHNANPDRERDENVTSAVLMLAIV